MLFDGRLFVMVRYRRRLRLNGRCRCSLRLIRVMSLVNCTMALGAVCLLVFVFLYGIGIRHVLRRLMIFMGAVRLLNMVLLLIRVKWCSC